MGLFSDETGKAKSVSWKDAPEGVTVTGIVTREPVKTEQRDPVSGQVKTWPKSGQPKTCIVVNMLIDGEERSLWANLPGSLATAIGDAEREAKADVAPGGELSVTFTHWSPSKAGAQMRNFTATYKPGKPDAQPVKPADPWQEDEPPF